MAPKPKPPPDDCPTHGAVEATRQSPASPSRPSLPPSSGPSPSAAPTDAPPAPPQSRPTDRGVGIEV